MNDFCRFLLYLIVCGSLLVSCNISGADTSTDAGVKPIIPFLADTILLDNGEYCNMETPLIYEDKLILMITNYETGEGWINCYDKVSLDLLWTWREALDEFGAPAKGFGSEGYIHNDILCVAQRNLSYGININTGTTIWKNRDVVSSQSYIVGFEDNIYGYTINDTDGVAMIRKSNIFDGTWENIFEIEKDDDLNVSVGSPYAFSWEGVDYVTFVSIKWGTGPHVENTWLNLYNLTEDHIEWISDTIPLQHNLSYTPGVRPVFEDGQILLASDALYSYNIEDGSLEWWKQYEHFFVYSSHITAANGFVYGNNENQFFTGVDVHTGEEKFRTPTGASASRIFYHDHKCYLSSLTVGGSNHLMVIDAETGEILQDEKAPFRSENVEWVFDRAIAVDPETGYVYTGDHRYLLVYDFGE